MTKSGAPPIHHPRQWPQPRGLAPPIPPLKNVRPQMRVALAIRQVDIEPLKRPNSLGNQAQQRHASIIYPEARGPLVILGFSCYEFASRRLPPAFSISAARAPSSSIGYTHAITAAR